MGEKKLSLSPPPSNGESSSVTCLPELNDLSNKYQIEKNVYNYIKQKYYNYVMYQLHF
jgi:hypothetical protein